MAGRIWPVIDWSHGLLTPFENTVPLHRWRTQLSTPLEILELLAFWCELIERRMSWSTYGRLPTVCESPVFFCHPVKPGRRTKRWKCTSPRWSRLSVWRGGQYQEHRRIVLWRIIKGVKCRIPNMCGIKSCSSLKLSTFVLRIRQ